MIKMVKEHFDALIKELKIIKKLLIANLYASGISSEELSEISGMDSGDIRKMVSKKKVKGVKNAKKD
jgi:hypothetical protein